MLVILALAATEPPELNVPMLMGFLLAFGLCVAWSMRAMRAARLKGPARSTPREFIGGRFGRLGEYVEPTPLQRSHYWLN
jgi:hypothetical protein